MDLAELRLCPTRGNQRNQMIADFIEQRLLSDWPSDSAALTDAVVAMQARGAT